MKYYNHESIAACLTNIQNAAFYESSVWEHEFISNIKNSNYPNFIQRQFLLLCNSRTSKSSSLHTLRVSLALRALSNTLWLPHHDMQLNRFRAPLELDIDFLLEAILLIVWHVGLRARLEVRGAVFEVRLFASC